MKPARELGLISGKFPFDSSTVLYSKIRPYLNKVAVPDFTGICSADIYPLKPNSRILDRNFLAYLLRQKDFLDYAEAFSARTSIPKINREALAAYEAPLPSLEEQSRIVAILDKGDAIRRKRQEAITLTEQLLRSTFLEMFGDPVTNPKRWPVWPFGDVLGELRYGTSQKCSDRPEPGMVPVLRIPNIVGGVVDTGDLKYAYLTDAELEQTRLRDGDILFVRSNGNPEYIGRCAVFHDSNEYAFASYLIRGRACENTKFSVDFAQAVMSFPSFRASLVREARTTAGNYNISTEGLRNLRLIHPPLELQQAFLRRANGIARLAKRYADSLSESDNLFNSLVQRAFSGQL